MENRPLGEITADWMHRLLLLSCPLLLPCLVGAFAPTARSALASSSRRTASSSIHTRMPWEPVDLDASEEEDAAAESEKPGISFEGLSQLITMGAGAPMLGELRKTNFNKPEAEAGAAMQFELEENNFEDENGNIKRGAYTDSGWVDEDAVDPMEALKKMWPFGGK